MRPIAILFLAVVVAVAIWLWGMGGADVVSRWAAQMQRDVQNGMAASLRALRAGEPGALLGLWGLCLTYGFVHAAGPGHGKLVIGGYGLGVRVKARKLAGLAVASSLAQALTAVIFVTVAVTVFGLGRAQLTAAADFIMAPLSYGLIALVGLWLACRGARKLLRTRPEKPAAVCSDCGHAHGPSIEQTDAVRTWRDAVAVIGLIAIRPCTGVIFLLILTYALDVYWVGIIGALVMGVGTAAFTGIVAFAAVGARESTLAQAASAQSMAILMSVAELAAGILIAAVASQLLLRVI